MINSLRSDDNSLICVDNVSRAVIQVDSFLNGLVLSPNSTLTGPNIYVCGVQCMTSIPLSFTKRF